MRYIIKINNDNNKKLTKEGFKELIKLWWQLIFYVALFIFIMIFSALFSFVFPENPFIVKYTIVIFMLGVFIFIGGYFTIRLLFEDYWKEKEKNKLLKLTKELVPENTEIKAVIKAYFHQQKQRILFGHRHLGVSCYLIASDDGILVYKMTNLFLPKFERKIDYSEIESIRRKKSSLILGNLNKVEFNLKNGEKLTYFSSDKNFEDFFYLINKILGTGIAVPPRLQKSKFYLFLKILFIWLIVGVVGAYFTVSTLGLSFLYPVINPITSKLIELITVGAFLILVGGFLIFQDKFFYEKINLLLISSIIFGIICIGIGGFIIWQGYQDFKAGRYLSVVGEIVEISEETDISIEDTFKIEIAELNSSSGGYRKRHLFEIPSQYFGKLKVGERVKVEYWDPANKRGMIKLASDKIVIKITSLSKEKNKNF